MTSLPSSCGTLVWTTPQPLAAVNTGQCCCSFTTVSSWSISIWRTPLGRIFVRRSSLSRAPPAPSRALSPRTRHHSFRFAPLLFRFLSPCLSLLGHSIFPSNFWRAVLLSLTCLLACLLGSACACARACSHSLVAFSLSPSLSHAPSLSLLPPPALSLSHIHTHATHTDHCQNPHHALRDYRT